MAWKIVTPEAIGRSVWYSLYNQLLNTALKILISSGDKRGRFDPPLGNDVYGNNLSNSGFTMTSVKQLLFICFLDLYVYHSMISLYLYCYFATLNQNTRLWGLNKWGNQINLVVNCVSLTIQLSGSGNAYYIAEMLYYSSPGLGLESDPSHVLRDLDLRLMDLNLILWLDTSGLELGCYLPKWKHTDFQRFF